MEAFHNDHLIKEKYLTRLNEHYQADEIIQGQYWENGKGCAVGCTIHSGNYKNYELGLGIPTCLAYVEDPIFKGLPNKLAKEFPLQFLSSIKVGANLSEVSKLFTIWLLTDIEYGVLQYVDDKKVIQDIADAFAQDMVSPVLEEEWKKLRKIAYAASYSSSSYSAAATAYYAAASASDFVAYYYYSYSAAAYSAAAAYCVSTDSAAYCHSNLNKNSKSEWYIGASKKLIELLKNAN